MRGQAPDGGSDNIIDIFTGRRVGRRPAIAPIARISPELDGICMLYSNFTSSKNLYRLPLICWSLHEDGQINAIVPWFDGPRCCSRLDDPDTGRWEGYMAPGSGTLFYGAPAHKIMELEAAAQFFRRADDDGGATPQEISDHTGTHALLIDRAQERVTLAEIARWRVGDSGEIEAMLAGPESGACTQILPGADCLPAARSQPEFRCLLEHRLARQIKSGHAEAMRAMAALLHR